MSLLLAGMNHRTTPIEERERFALPPPALPAALAALRAVPGVSEGMIVSTCNRVEVLVSAADGLPEPDLAAFLAGRGGAASPLPPQLYCYRADDAVRHLFRVASSLDSLVVGEPQILGQLKHAFACAQAAGTIGPQLEAVVTRAFRVAKRVRTETAIASQPVSVSRAGVELARRIFGGLEGKCVLLIGAGAMGELTAAALRRQGAGALLVANRTSARAAALAAKYGGEVVPLAALPEAGARADVVITCAGAGELLIRRADAAHFLAQRRQRPMLFLDLSVPRDVDPAIHRLGNAFVYNVDDLDRVVSSNLEERRRHAERAEAIVQAELIAWCDRRQTRAIAPTLRALQAHGEALLQAELDRLRRRSGDLRADQTQEVEIHMRRFMQKLLHQPLAGLRAAAGDPELDSMLELVRRLYGLPEAREPAAATLSGAAHKEAAPGRTETDGAGAPANLPPTAADPADPLQTSSPGAGLDPPPPRRTAAGAER